VVGHWCCIGHNATRGRITGSVASVATGKRGCPGGSPVLVRPQRNAALRRSRAVTSLNTIGTHIVTDKHRHYSLQTRSRITDTVANETECPRSVMEEMSGPTGNCIRNLTICTLHRTLCSAYVGAERYKQTKQTNNKLHGLSPQANYTDRATAACRRSDCQLVRIEGATWSA
jgi:hypothetical protein